MSGDLSGLSMQELFRLEAESQTAVLSAGILAIEELERSPETIESLMRAAHSLKGAARIVNLEPAVRVAHALEDVFVAAGRGGLRVRPEHGDRLLAAVDFLGSIARADDALAPASQWPSRADALVADLSALLAAPGDAPPPAAAPAVAAAPPTIPFEPRPGAGDTAPVVPAG
ncbi:MAG: Hpt domain-containing protein, partial [Planctomycetaceae bacterium]